VSRRATAASIASSSSSGIETKTFAMRRRYIY
jgi:hypothetical protein